MRNGAAVSVAFGLLMVAAVGLPSGPLGRIAAGLTLAGVVAAVRWRAAAGAAVVMAAAAVALSGPPAGYCAVAGLAAAGYLVSRHSGALTPPAVAGMAGFGLAGLSPAVAGVRLDWAPLAAPVAVVALLTVVAVRVVGAARHPGSAGGRAVRYE